MPGLGAGDGGWHCAGVPAVTSRVVSAVHVPLPSLDLSRRLRRFRAQSDYMANSGSIVPPSKRSVGPAASLGDRPGTARLGMWSYSRIVRSTMGRTAGGRFQRRARNPIHASGGPAANHLFRLFHRRFAPQNRPRPRPGRRWADGFVAAAIPKYADITMPGARRPMLSRCARSRAFPPPSRAARLPRASSPRCGPLARPNRRRRRLSRRAEGRSTNTRAILSARNTCLPKPETTKYRWKTSGNEAILKTD